MSSVPADLEALRRRIGAIEAGFGQGRDARPVATTGHAAIDAALPWGGLPLAALHEVSGIAASGFVAALARRFVMAGGALLWCADRGRARLEGEPYGPGLARFGLDAAQCVLVRCRREEDVLWAMAEGLRSKAVVCVVGEIKAIDLVASRRLQIAAEAGGGAGLLLAGAEPDLAPNAALTRWRIAPGRQGGRRCWKVDLWRARGAAPGTWRAIWDEQALSFIEPAGPADRAAASGGPARGPALSG